MQRLITSDTLDVDSTVIYLVNKLRITSQALPPPSLALPSPGPGEMEVSEVGADCLYTRY